MFPATKSFVLGAVLASLTLLDVDGGMTSSTGATLQHRSSGAGVVEAVCDLLESSCIFADDRQFMRRLAYVESTDGADKRTFRAGYFGGIWQVDDEMFKATQTPQAMLTLRANITAVQQTFNIQWNTVTWNNLTIPLYSALAARLYLLLQATGARSIPRSIEDQAVYWKNNYRPSASEENFIRASERLELGCSRALGADIIFVLDDSGSVLQSDYARVRSFVADVVRSFDVGSNTTQVGLMHFSDSAQVWFNLSSHRTKEQVLNAVGQVPYTGSGTNTHLALDHVVDRSFQAAYGARQGSPRVCIVVTDGASNDHSRTLVAARRLHHAGITVFAVGVGNGINMVELQAIASRPVCQHLILLNNYIEIDSIKNQIEKRTCEAPLLMNSGEPAVQVKLSSGTEQNCKLKVQPGGATVTVTTSKGATTLYTASLTYPSGSYYEGRVRATPGHRGVLFVSPPASSNSSTSRTQDESFVFCRIEAEDVEDGDQSSGTDRSRQSNVSVAVVTSVGNDECATLAPCQNGGICQNLARGWNCSCKSGWTGQNCDEDANDCRSTQCDNDGVCRLEKSSGSWVCNCAEGWTGPQCNQGLLVGGGPGIHSRSMGLAPICWTAAAAAAATGWMRSIFHL